MKFALNLLSASPLLIVGIIALVIIGIAAIAFVLVYTHKMSKKPQNALETQLPDTAVTENSSEQPAPPQTANEPAEVKPVVQEVVEEPTEEPVVEEVVEEPAEVVAEEVAEEPAQAVAEEVAEETAEEPVAEAVVKEPTEVVAEEVAEETAEEPVVQEVAQEIAVEPTPAPVDVQEETHSEKINIRVAYNRSLTAKLMQADDVLKDYYSDIKNELLSYKKVKSRMSWRHETFRRGRKLLAKFTVRGKTLGVYFALDPDNYAGTKYKIKDVSHMARNASVPSLYKIKNERRRRFAKQLIADLMQANGVIPGAKSETDFKEQYPYASTEELIVKNLIKLVPWKEFGSGSEVGVISVSEEELTEEVEQAIVPEEAVELPAEQAEPVTEQTPPQDFIRIRVRYNRSFTAKLIQADDTVKNYYGIIKNELLSYKKVKSRISWRQETFRRGRKLLARMQIRGKTLGLYLALNPADYEGTRYKVLDVSDIARNAEVPALYKIKNDRRCRYAKQLIADLMQANEVPAGKEQTEDYVSQYPYEEIEPLIDRKLVRLVPWKEFVAGSEVGVITVKEDGVTEEIALASEQPAEDDYVEEAVSNFFDEPEEEEKQEESLSPEPEITIDVAEADEILGDEYVEAFVHQSEKYSDKTKKEVVNIDTLGKYFNAGERVTLEEIKKRVPGIGNRVTYIKVLARGKLDKALTVEADDFSPQAIKMIVLTGGSVERKARK